MVNNKFYIKKNSSLPELIYTIPHHYFKDIVLDKELIKNVAVTFSMSSNDDGTFQIANSPAEFVINENPYDISNKGKYNLKYKFNKFDTSNPGVYLGEFKIDFLHPQLIKHYGTLTLPPTNKIKIVVLDSITKTDVILQK